MLRPAFRLGRYLNSFPLHHQQLTAYQLQAFNRRQVQLSSTFRFNLAFAEASFLLVDNDDETSKKLSTYYLDIADIMYSIISSSLCSVGTICKTREIRLGAI